jgi:glycosyltransferase involved in cell wall biosynthesis
MHNTRVAVVVPCFNEALAIAAVIQACRQALPNAEIYIFDNASTDETAEIAQQAAANVVTVHHRGKGNVVRRMFADVDADIYVMLDGDATYDVSMLPLHVEQVCTQGLDMLVGRRVDDGDIGAYRAGHRWGNRLLTGTVARLFGGPLGDMLSGYRIFSRRYVKSFPALTLGFEIETELTVHALELRMPSAEVPVRYFSRPEGSASKLSTYRDGWKILCLIARLVISERPLQFFSVVGGILLLIALAMGTPLFMTYLDSGLVPRFPTAILATGTVLTAMVALACGVILHTVTLGRREIKRLAYLAIHGPLAAPTHQCKPCARAQPWGDEDLAKASTLESTT